MANFEERVRDRRRMGVNFFSVLRAAKKVTSRPEFEPGSPRELVESILEEIVGKDLPQARSDMPEIDWDSLLAFIEKLLPIILMIFGL
ncbi:MAG: hypothetical protein U9N61_09515 [Euryarchaeota archaeon]|nr:hypothetical protein [Euryarchaeota archaeon]